MNTDKPDILEALILISLVSLIVSRALRELFIEILEYSNSDDGSVSSSLLPQERQGKAVSRRNGQILRRVAERLGFEVSSLVESPMNDALNPYDHCISSLEEV